MATHNVPRSALLERTVHLLRNRPRPLTLQVVSDDTKLHMRWLQLLLSRPKVSPSVDAIVVLYEYLTNKKLSIE